MYDFGIDLGASFTKVAYLRRAVAIDLYADPVFNTRVAGVLGDNAPYWWPHVLPPARSFLVPSAVLIDRRHVVPQLRIGQPAWDEYRAILEELERDEAARRGDRRVAAYPFFNWKRRFLTEPDNAACPQPHADGSYTWTHVATDFLRRLRESIGEMQAVVDGGHPTNRLDDWMQHREAHTRVCLPRTPHTQLNAANLENRVGAVLRAAGWPVAEDRKVISWEGTANLLGRITRGRSRWTTLAGRGSADVDAIFHRYGFQNGRPREGWTCMAVDVGHYTTDVAIYRYQRDNAEFVNPAVMDAAIFTCSEEVGVSSHLDARINALCEEFKLPRPDAYKLLRFKALWTVAAMRGAEGRREAGRFLGVGDANVARFVSAVQDAYVAFAAAVSHAVTQAVQRCAETWKGRPDATRFPNLHVNMIFLSGGVMEANDLREVFENRLRAVRALENSAFDGRDTPTELAMRKWNTRLRSACAAGAISALGDSWK